MGEDEHTVADTADLNKPSLTFILYLFRAPIKSLEQVCLASSDFAPHAPALAGARLQLL